MKELFSEFTDGFVLSVEIDLDKGLQTLFIRGYNKETGETTAEIAEKQLSKSIDKITTNSDDFRQIMQRIELGNSILKNFDAKILRLNLSLALDNIKKQYIDFISELDTYREQERKKEEEYEIEQIHKEADRFYEFLDENDLTLFGYLEYLSRWFSGGEARNVLIGFLCAFGTFSGVKPLWFMALGKAGEGKSFIEEAVLNLVPQKFIENGLKTPAALVRKGQIQGLDYLDKKILTMGDLGDPKDYEDYRRVMHKYKKMTTEGHDEFEAVADNPDPVTGERQTILMELKGYPSVLFTSVNTENVDDQFLSRGLTATPESSDEQVSMFVRYMQSGSIWNKKTKNIIRNELPMLHGYLQTIGRDDTDVINPYYYCLEKWFEDDEYFKRALTKYPELVKIVTYLHAHEREMIDVDGMYYYISTKQDNMIVAQLMNPSNNLSGVAINVFNQLLKYYQEYSEAELHEFLEGEIHIKECKTIFSVGSAQLELRKNRKFRGLQYGDIFRNLSDAGLIEAIEKVPRSNKNIYIISQHEKLGHKPIDFDQKLIDEYVEEIPYIYGATPLEIYEKIGKEKNSDKYSKNPFGKLKPAPWF